MLSETLKTSERLLQVLGTFSRAEPELTIADLTVRLKISRTAVTRIVATLENAAYIERVPGSSRYRIGIAACELGALYLSGHSLVDVARDVLVELAEHTGFTVYLGVRRDSEVVILSAHEGTTPVRFIWSVGDRLPIATTALGKAQLLHLPIAAVDAMLGLKTLPGISPGSITERATLDRQLDSYRSKQWIPAFEESYPGVCAVGAAILDAEGAPIAGISVSFLGAANDSSLAERMGGAVLEAARTIGRRVISQSVYGGRRAGASPAPR